MGVIRSLMFAGLIAVTAACTPQAGSEGNAGGQPTARAESDANAGGATTEAADEASLLKDAAQDPRSECRRHCTMNHAECRRTANSPEARNECFAAYNDCTRSC